MNRREVMVEANFAKVIDAIVWQITNKSDLRVSNSNPWKYSEVRYYIRPKSVIDIKWKLLIKLLTLG